MTRERLAGARSFFAPDRQRGGARDLERRAADARTLHQRSIGDHRAAWDEAVRAIAVSPRYGGLVIPPQLGLVPLGPDAHSGLFEFAHIGPTGSLPRRRATDESLTFGGSACIVLVLIPGGLAQLGHQRVDPDGARYCDQAQPHEGLAEVLLEPFFIGKYAITQGQYERRVGRIPNYYWPGWAKPPFTVDLRQGADSIDWHEAYRFATSLDLILPTAAQHEYATRAGTSTPFWTGVAPESLSGSENARLTTAAVYVDEDDRVLLWPGLALPGPVGVYRANPFGLYDMAGNGREWCLDRYRVDRFSSELRGGDGLHGPLFEPDLGRPIHRNVRGGRGSVMHSTSGARQDEIESGRLRDVGFRVARALDPVERGHIP